MGKEHEIIKACKDADSEKVKKLIASKNRTHTISFRKNNYIGSTDADGCTALHYAALKDLREIVTLLLANGASVTVKDNKGWLPLHYACFSNSYEIALLLLRHDITNKETVNAQSFSKDTPLHVATTHNHSSVISTLLQYGADATIRNVTCETALDISCRLGYSNIVRLLVNSCPSLNFVSVDSASNQGAQPPSPLHLAAKSGKKDATQIVDILLNAGFDINHIDSTGSALHVAALFGRLQMVEFLLSKGINVGMRNEDGMTVLDELAAHSSDTANKITQIIQNQHLWPHIEKMIQKNASDNPERVFQPEVDLDPRKPKSPPPKPKRSAILSVPNIKSHQHDESQTNNNNEPSLKRSQIWQALPETSKERVKYDQQVNATSKTRVVESITEPANVTPNGDSKARPAVKPRRNILGLCVQNNDNSSQEDIGRSSSSVPNPKTKVLTKTSSSPKSCKYRPMSYDNIPKLPVSDRYDNVANSAQPMMYDNKPLGGGIVWQHDLCTCGQDDGGKDNQAEPRVLDANASDVSTPLFLRSFVPASGCLIVDHHDHHPNVHISHQSQLDYRPAALSSDYDSSSRDQAVRTKYWSVTSDFASLQSGTLPSHDDGGDVTQSARSLLVRELSGVRPSIVHSVPTPTYDCRLSHQSSTSQAAVVVSRHDRPSHEEVEAQLIDRAISDIQADHQELMESISASNTSSSGGNTNNTTTFPRKSPKNNQSKWCSSDQIQCLVVSSSDSAVRNNSLKLNRELSAPLAKPESISSVDAASSSLMSASNISYHDDHHHEPTILVREPVTTSLIFPDHLKPTWFSQQSEDLQGSQMESSCGTDELEALSEVGSCSQRTNLDGSSVTGTDSSIRLQSKMSCNAECQTGDPSLLREDSVCSCVCSQCTKGNCCGSVASASRCTSCTPQPSSSTDVEQGNTINNQTLNSNFNSHELHVVTSTSTSANFDSTVADSAMSIFSTLEADKKREVVLWLKECQFDDIYSEKLLQNGFDHLDYMHLLNPEAIKLFGVKDPVENKRLLAQAKQLSVPPVKNYARHFRVVSDWLFALGLGPHNYLPDFMGNGFTTIDSLNDIDDTFLKLMQINAYGHRQRIIWSIREQPIRIPKHTSSNINLNSTSSPSVALESRPRTKPTKSTIATFDPLMLLSDHAPFGSSENAADFLGIDGAGSPTSTLSPASPPPTYLHSDAVIKSEGVSYQAQYLSSKKLDPGFEPEEVHACIERVLKTDVEKFPLITFNINCERVRCQDPETSVCVVEHKICEVLTINQHSTRLNAFAYVSREIGDVLLCNIFAAADPEIARDICLTFYQAFDTAFKLASSKQTGI